MSKLIGKIIADASGLTEKLGGEKKGKFDDIKEIKLNTKVNTDEWKKFKQEVKAAKGDEILIKAAIDKSGIEDLKKIDELYDYALLQSKSGKDVDLGEVNSLIKEQNYKNIADQAHGFLGVKKAIDAYNDSLIKNEDGTTKASDGTKKLSETISQSNSSLGKYLTNLNGATAGIFSYGKSLATATLKTFALETATMALNTATSLGISFLISAGLSALTSFIDNIIVTKEEIKEAGEAARNTIDEIITNFDNLKKETDDVKVRFANLAQGVDNLGKVNQSRGKLTTDDYEEFLDLSNQLADLFPQLKIGYDDNGNAILDLSGNVDTIVGSLNSLVEVQKKLANQKIMEEMPDVWAEYKSDLKDYNEELGESQKKQKGYDNALKKLSENRKFEYVQDYDKTDGGFESSDRAIMKTLEDLGHKSYDYFTQEEWGNGQYKINWDLSSLSENEFGKIVNRLQTLAKDYKEEADFTKGEIESANSKITNYINTWLSDEWNYDKLSPDMKKVAKDALVNSNWVEQLPDSIDTSDWDEVSVWLEQNFLHAIYEIDDQGIKTALNGVLTDNFTVDSLHGIIESLIKTQGFSKDNPLIIYLQSKIDGKKDAEEKYKSTLTESKHKLGGYNHDEKGYETNNEVGNKLDQFWKENVLTEEDVDLWSEVTEGITDSTKALNAFINAKKGISEVPKTFDQAWKSIGTSGDEKADKKAKEAKEELLELAKAGKLTEEAFSKSNIAENFLKQTKLSAEEATQEINKLVSSADQLSSMKTGISSISSILGERESGSDIGIDTLKGMPEDVKAQTKEYEHFVEVICDGTKGMDECQDAANKLATAYVTSGNFLANLTDENENYYKSVLKEMGVKNAANIVENTLIAKKQAHELKTKALAAATEDMGKKTSKATDKFVEQADMTKLAKVELTDLIAKERIFAADSGLNTSEKVTELNKLALAYFGVSNAIQISSAMGSDSRYWNSPEDYEKAVLKQWNKTIKKQTKLVVTGVDVKAEKSSSNSGSGKGKKEKTKSAKQQFDWINRALDRLSSRLDLVKSKYDNLFNNKKAKDSNSLLTLQNKNLDDQYKLLKRTAKYQGKAQKKYTKKSKKVRISKNKKENASLKKAVRQGRIKGSMKDLIATYGEKKATKIQKYQDWYDKAREAEKNKISAQKARRDNRIQKYQNLADNADEKRSLAQTQKENATTATAKNDFIKKEKESVEASYNYQIKIANLKRDSLKVDQLRVEKAKELRDLEIEQHQNLADEHQAVLDQYSAEKELAAKASEKNAIITQEEAKTRELYAEKITIAGLEGNSSEQKRLEAELNKQLLDFDVERHQNLADEYQSELDKSSAEKANLTTANKKNAIVEKEKALTKQLYAEKIAIAYIEGKISEGEQLQEELARQMVVLEKEKLDNIASYYSNLRKITELQNKNLGNAVDELEARGMIVTSKLYSSQIALNNEQKRNREEELMLLEEQHDKIEKDTQEWYDSLDAIQACKDNISDLTKNTIELEKAIRNVGWQLFDKLSSRIDLISSEYDLAIKLMSNKKLTDDDTGNFTEEGTATLSAYYSQLLLTQEKVNSMRKNLEDMKKHIDNGDPGYTDPAALNEYNEKYQEYISLIENEYDIQQNLIDLMKEKYKAELDYLQDLISRRKELLQAEKDAYDYQRNIAEKTKNITSLQKQMISISGDDSESAMAKKQQIQVKLDEANQDLADTEYQQWISDQQTMLDNLYNEYEDFIDDKLNDVDALLKEAVTYLSGINIGESVSETLDTYYTKYGYAPTEDLKNINTALGTSGSIVTAIGNAATTITNYMQQQQRYQGMADEVETSISKIGNVYEDVSAIERFNQAKASYDRLAAAGDNGENIQKHVSSSAVSTLDTTGSEIQKIYASVQEVMNAINSVNLDNKSDYNETNLRLLENANQLYNNLSTSGKQLLADDWKNTLNHRNLQSNYWNGVIQQETADASKEEEQRKQNDRTSFERMIKETYYQDAWLHGGKLEWSTSTLNTDINGNLTPYGQVQQRIFNHGITRDDKPYINKKWIEEACSRLGLVPTKNASSLLNYMNSIGFSKGGIADALQKIPSMNGDDGWITVKKGEGILTPEQTKAFIDFVHNQNGFKPNDLLHKNMSKLNADINTHNETTTIGDIHLNLELPNVIDSQSFVKEFQTNPKIEKIVRSMIYDSSLGKYRW